MQWQSPKLEDLARQLMYSPEAQRVQQLAAARELRPTVEPDRDYPFEFVLFRLTGYRPRQRQDATISGAALAADLDQLIAALAGTFSEAVDAVAEPVLTLDEVTEHFKVSSKTIQRWRRLGLKGQRFTFPDGKKRLGFRRSQVTAFAQKNAGRVAQAGSFTQLSETEREKILAMARRYAARRQCCIKDISQRIGRHLGRSPETVRYTIRKHDQDHPEAAIFAGPGQDLRAGDRRTILQYHERGLTVQEIARRYCREPEHIEQVLHAERAERLKAEPIRLVANPLFDLPDADEIVLKTLPAQALEQARKTVQSGTNAQTTDLLMARAPRGLPAPLAAIFRQPVMPQELETDAFRRMNYLKSKAQRRVAALDEKRATAAEIAAIEALLESANKIKNELVQANLQVAVHVARKHQRPGLDLMELVSDATVWLMRAAETFDFARKVKFSTYASYALMKNFARHREDAIAGPQRGTLTGQEAMFAELAGHEENLGEQLDMAHLRANLQAALGELPTRERALIEAYYGLADDKRAPSLQELGAQLGVTKARVRQLQMRALGRLREQLVTN